MLIVGDVLLSEDILERQFACNIEACKGACCIEGDAGAPLEEGEAELIAANIELIRTEMDPAGLASLEAQGISELDVFDEPVTTCKPNKECTFVVKENGVLQCAIEKADLKHNFGFRKPISCHLYPIRVKKLKTFEALNYHKWDICSAACELGKKENIRVYQFARTALVRKFGEAWYQELDDVAKDWLLRNRP